MNFKKLLVAAVFLASGTALAGYHPDFQGPQSCTECHESEGKAWKGTRHFKTFKKLHRDKDAKAIAKKMGIKRIKKDKTCAQCHYSGQKVGKPKAGISCESCHGIAKDWIKIHNDYGGKSVTKETETPAHKKKRIAASIKAGMIRPENIYDVASNCFECHTVPYEKLVEVGGHKAGSDFELVSWSQGEVRHNFLNGTNSPATAERKRVLYVAGRILDLEYGLRGVAEVTKKSAYAVKMAKRVKKALGHVKKINGALNDPVIGEIIALASGAKLKPNNKAAIMKAVNKISKKGRKLLNGNDGKAWAAIDGQIPTETKGTAVQ